MNNMKNGKLKTDKELSQLVKKERANLLAGRFRDGREVGFKEGKTVGFKEGFAAGYKVGFLEGDHYIVDLVEKSMAKSFGFATRAELKQSAKLPMFWMIALIKACPNIAQEN